MAFIRWSGVRPLIDEHSRATARRVTSCRVLTTTYTDSTEQRALDALRDAGAEVRVSYDTTQTRLHAKAWIFHRVTGYSTAYIGSSNLTHSAPGDGPRVERADFRARGTRDALEKMVAVFESYWESGDVRAVRPRGVRRAHRAADGRAIACSEPGRDRARAPSRRGCSSSSRSPASGGTTATCSSRPRAPARR